MQVQKIFKNLNLRNTEEALAALKLGWYRPVTLFATLKE